MKKIYQQIIITILIGFILNFVISLKTILQNNYFQYKLYYLIIDIILKNVTDWIIFSIIFGLSIYLIKSIYETVKANQNKYKIIAVLFRYKLYLIILIGIGLGTMYRNYLKTLFFLVHNNYFSYSILIDFLLIVVPVIVIYKLKINLRKILFFDIVIIFIILISLFVRTQWSEKGYPNIIIIGIDTLRADHLGCYGYNRQTTPNIDKIAENSIIFKKTISTSSWTLPAFMSLFTGLYPKNHGVINDGFKLSQKRITLAEILKNYGYSTAAFISGPYLKSIYGFDQGFDVYNEQVSSVSHIKSHKDITSHKINYNAIKWLNEKHQQPFFLFLHYWDPHYDYIPPSPYNKIFDKQYKGDINGKNIEKSNKINPDMNKDDLNHIISLYDGEILWTDYHIGKIMDYFKSFRLYKNSIIVIVGDHGDEFLEHNGKGHRHSLYNELIHIPLIIKLPGNNNMKQVNNIVSIADVVPSLLGYLNIDLNVKFDGYNIISSDYYLNREYVVSSLHGILTALINDKYKTIYNKSNNTFQFYDMKRDWQEQNQNSGFNKGIQKKLRRDIFKYVKDYDIQNYNIKIDNTTRKQLKALGYIK